MKRMFSLNVLATILVALVIADLAFARSASNEECSLSSEAKNKKLFRIFNQVQRDYYRLQPYLIASNVAYKGSDVKMHYAPYLPNSETLERNAKKSQELLKKLKKWKGDRSKLKPREERLIHQFQYFLNSNFDSIYERYYDGIWLLGPDYFCEQPICYALEYFHQALIRMVEIDGPITSLTDMKNILSLVKSHRSTFEQYLKNVKDGIKSGMVWSQEVCKASAKTFRKIYSRVRKDPEGILKMKFAQLLMNGITSQGGLYKKLANTELEQFKDSHKGESYEEKLKTSIIENIGKPLHALIVYLKEEHVQYCPPSEISSGLGSLPLKNIYKNGKIIGETTQKLPGTEIKIDVKTGYDNLLKYYTSGNYTGTQAFDLGTSLADSYYKEVEDLAVEITKQKDKSKAVEELKKLLKSDQFIFNKEKFPENESDDEAHENCDNDEDAQKSCPNRWKSFEAWKKNNTEIMKQAKGFLKDLFYFEGANKTTPDCPVKIVADYDPTNGVPSYLESDPDCDAPAEYYLPFFKNKMGPSFDDYNTNFHEARPGHHLQIQGYLENFMDECEDISMWINNLVDYYPSFSEGWGLYAENPILMEDLDILKDDGFSKYRALKWQIWRSLRLIADVGFHQRNISRAEILEKFQKYTWDTSDTVEKELTRYQGTPGQATSYTLGQQTILKLRNETKTALGDKFDIKEFHYALLSVGQAPFDYIKIHLNNYIKCKTNRQKEFKYCNLFLNSNSGSRKRDYTYNVNDPIKLKRQNLIKHFSQSTRRKKHL